jgi:hypothetical protein
MSDSNERKESLVEIVGLPTLAAGAGTLIGGVMGGGATRRILETPGIQEKLRRMTSEKRRNLVHTLHSLGSGAAGTASAVGSYGLSEYIRDRMDKRREMERGRK